MPETQITKIKPESAWLRLDLKDLWTYRELLYFLTWRDVKVRYKQTAIGVLWAILQPVLTTAIFTVIFTQFARFDSLAIPYPLFALSGLLIWLFVNSSVTMAAGSLIANTNLVTKVYFPRLIVPLSAALAGLIDLALGFVMLAAVMFYYGVSLSWQLLLAPFFIFQAVVLTLSFGTFFSALNVRFRDVKFALPFALQVWMFASPVFYPLDIFPEKWRLAFALNPLAGALEGFRAAIFGTPFDWRIIGISLTLTAAAAFISLIVFKRMEDDFADLV